MNPAPPPVIIFDSGEPPRLPVGSARRWLGSEQNHCRPGQKWDENSGNLAVSAGMPLPSAIFWPPSSPFLSMTLEKKKQTARG